MTYQTKTITLPDFDIVTAYLRLRGDQTMLLENIPFPDEKHQVGMIALQPVHEFQALGQTVTIDGKSCSHPDPLQALSDLVVTGSPVEGKLPMTGGAIGYVGFDTIAAYESLGDTPPDPLNMPDIHMFVYETFVMFDAEHNKVTIVADDTYSQVGEAALTQRVLAVQAKLFTPNVAEMQPVRIPEIKTTSNFSKTAFESVVTQAKDYITAGDMFQMVPSQRFSFPVRQDPFDYYRQLRLTNTTAYLSYLDFGNVQIVGASPERLVKVQGRQVVTNPIAGTRHRGQDQASDEAAAKSLLQDEKERAEHEMLVDLGRNDLGKVATYGSVHVTKLMALQKYQHVMHLVSEVVGTMLPDTPAIAALKATLPAGTVSGAPKVRAMQRIYEMEPVKRGVYAGAIGYLTQSDQMDFAIAIRTMVVKDGQGHVQAGAGIVYDSIPENEYQETRNKAQALLGLGASK